MEKVFSQLFSPHPVSAEYDSKCQLEARVGGTVVEPRFKARGFYRKAYLGKF